MNKKAILIVGLIVVLIVTVVIVNRVTSDEEIEQTDTSTTGSKEKYVEVQADGSKKNISEKLTEEKTIEGVTISNITLTESGGISQILAELKNETEEATGGYSVTITMLDENGEVIEIIAGYIDELEAGETGILNASATADFANAYDFKIEKQ